MTFFKNPKYLVSGNCSIRINKGQPFSRKPGSPSRADSKAFPPVAVKKKGLLQDAGTMPSWMEVRSWPQLVVTGRSTINTKNGCGKMGRGKLMNKFQQKGEQALMLTEGWYNKQKNPAEHP
jgi:hypothetical protein